MRNRSALGWGELLVGIAFIILGAVTFVRPSGALSGVVFVYGLMAIVGGIADIVYYVKMERRTGFGPAMSLVMGILSILAGIFLLLNIDAGKWALVILFPLWFITHCITRLCRLSEIRLLAGSGYYYFTLIVNIVGLVLGFAMIFNPTLSFVSVSYIIGLYLILMGVDYLVQAVSDIGSR